MKTHSTWTGQTIADSLRARLTLYRPAELAACLGISKPNILTAIKTGALKAHRVNARRFEIESGEAARWWVSLTE